MIAGKHVASNLKEILSTPQSSYKLRTFTSGEVMEELERCNFFPIMDTTTGTISFTNSYEKISKLHGAEVTASASKKIRFSRLSKELSTTSVVSSNLSFDSDE